MKPIYIDKNTKGILVHAVSKSIKGREWLVLIQSVNDAFTSDGKLICNIKRHISCCLETTDCYIGEQPGNWGDTKDYDLYEPTEDDFKIIRSIMKQKGYRFIKILNKLEKYDETNLHR